MKAIAIVLLFAVFVRHESAFWLADATGFNPRAMHYILGGAYEVVLAAVISFMLFACARTVWRDLGIAAMVIAALEGAQIAACRALVTDIKSVPASVNLCDYLVGFPLGHVMMSLYTIIIVGSIANAVRSA